MPEISSIAPRKVLHAKDWTGGAKRNGEIV